MAAMRALIHCPTQPLGKEEIAGGVAAVASAVVFLCRYYVSCEMLMWLCPKMMGYHQMVNFRAPQPTFAQGICSWLRQHYSEDVQKQALLMMELEHVLEIRI